MPPRLIAITVLLTALACEASPAATPDAGATAGDAGAAAASVDVAAADAAAECMPKVHPGTVTFLNEETGEVKVKMLTPAEEPAWWASTAEGRVPIVKSVYRKTASGQAEIFLYGPCNQLLEVVLGPP